MFAASLYKTQRPGPEEKLSGSVWKALKCGVGGEWRKLNGQRK